MNARFHLFVWPVAVALLSCGGTAPSPQPVPEGGVLPLLSDADQLTVIDNPALPTCAALALSKQLKRAPSFNAPLVSISGNLVDGARCP